MSEAPRALPAYAALAHRDFALYQVARFLLTLAIQMQSVAVGWQVYSLTHRALDLGYVGLAQFLPAIGLSLIAGHAADRFDRQRLVMVCYVAIALYCAILVGLSVVSHTPVWALYLVLVFLGTARAFAAPATQALVPHLVPAEVFPNAVTWNSTCFQIATTLGPAFGGVIYGWAGNAATVYSVSFGLSLVACACLSVMRVRTGRMEQGEANWANLVAGIQYVRRHQIVLGSISLDLFAVLLGGAVALLPVYAQDILHVGPWGLGLLRSAPALGATAMAAGLMYRPLERRVGRSMLICVALFGVATIVFGLSHNFGLSLVALAVAGAVDMVSMVVRMTLVQIATPPSMRGRVSAVNMVFIGASNELGEFESGLTAAWLGAVPAVVLGGLGTCAVVALWSVWFPELRQVDRLDDVVPSP